MRRTGLWTGILLAALAALCVAAAAVAQPQAAAVKPDGGPAGVQVDPGAAGVPPRGARMMAALGLTEAQQKAIAKLRADGWQERLAWQKELLRLRNELRGVMLADDPDVRAIDKLTGEIGGLEGRLRASHLRQQVAIRKALTPEQRDKWLLMGGGGPHGWGRDGAGRGRHGGRGFGLGRGMGPHGLGRGMGPDGLGCPFGERGGPAGWRGGPGDPAEEPGALPESLLQDDDAI